MKNQKNQMTLTLCLEDNTGKDTNLEVRPDDDFGSFLQKAKFVFLFVSFCFTQKGNVSKILSFSEKYWGTFPNSAT